MEVRAVAAVVPTGASGASQGTASSDGDESSLSVSSVRSQRKRMARETDRKKLAAAFDHIVSLERANGELASRVKIVECGIGHIMVPVPCGLAARVRAITASLEAHVRDCLKLQQDVHSAHVAAQLAGSGDAIVHSRANVAKHHSLWSQSNLDPSSLDRAALNALQRAAKLEHRGCVGHGHSAQLRSHIVTSKPECFDIFDQDEQVPKVAVAASQSDVGAKDLMVVNGEEQLVVSENGTEEGEAQTNLNVDVSSDCGDQAPAVISEEVQTVLSLPGPDVACFVAADSRAALDLAGFRLAFEHLSAHAKCRASVDALLTSPMIFKMDAFPDHTLEEYAAPRAVEANEDVLLDCAMVKASFEGFAAAARQFCAVAPQEVSAGKNRLQRKRHRQRMEKNMVSLAGADIVEARVNVRQLDIQVVSELEGYLMLHRCISKPSRRRRRLAWALWLMRKLEDDGNG